MTPMNPQQGMPIEPSGMGGPLPQQPPMVMPQMPQEPENEEPNLANLMDYALREANIAKRIKNKKNKDGTYLLDEIGKTVVEGFETDLESVRPWLKNQREAIELATLMANKEKSFPWPKASNVKYPLVATAAMQFSARAYPSLVPNDGNIVKARVIGKDEDGSRSERASRVAQHMSYQVMYKMPNWEEDMDKLCMVNAIIGTSFKKTYTCDGYINSELIPADRLIVNYYAKSLEKAYRKTEILHYTKNELFEKFNNDEEFLEIKDEELGEPKAPEINSELKSSQNQGAQLIEQSKVDQSTPYEFLSQHTFWDLDGDGYEEPYIITVHKDSKKVVRIIARWSSEGEKKNADGKIYKIEPIEYFTKFGFIPNPDSNIYDIGFGVLLGPTNSAIDTLINQLIDAGTLSNLQSGFISKGLRIKMGEVAFKPGEWKIANATGEEMKSGIVPLPAKDPSPVLLQLVQMLITSGNQLASVAEIFTGKMPGQNTPATTTQETVEQGMKVFTAIYKRLYRSMYNEFKKIYDLNRINPNIVEEQAAILNIPLKVSDYDGPVDDLIPSADPTGDSTATRMMKLQQFGQLVVPLGTANIPEFSMRIATALEMPNPQALIQPPPPPQPDPQVQKVQADIQAKQQETQMKMVAEQQKLKVQEELAQMKLAMEQMKLAMKEREMQLDQVMQQNQLRLDMMTSNMSAQMKMKEAQQNMMVKTAQSKQDMELARQSGEMKIKQQEESHNMKLRQQKQVQANQAKNKPRNKPNK